MTNAEYLNLVAKLVEAAAAYYNGTGLTMTDAEYDAGLEATSAYEVANPDKTADHDLLEVAAGLVAGGDVAHSVPMLSLAKVTTDEALGAWGRRIAKELGAMPDVVIEPKLDGIALSAVYENGVLVRAVTRGDGLTGEDVTDRLPTNVDGLPRTLPMIATVEVRGEMVFTREQFAAANVYRTTVQHKAEFVNARNAVAGSIRRDDIDPDDRPAMTFFAYSAVPTNSDHTDVVERLESFGFSPALRLAENIGNMDLFCEKPSAQDLTAFLSYIGEDRAKYPCDIDGAVIKVNDATLQTKLGQSSRTPNWAVAWKFAAEEASTTLLDIDVQVGRTGVHTPVARLDPVFVGGTTITNVTLHNPSDLELRDVRPGDTVVVRRAGDVIPEITGHIHRPADSKPWVMPTECISCGSDLDTSEKRWRCINRHCDAGAGAGVIYACSRDALDIEGFGEGTVTALLEAGLVRSLADLDRLAATDIIGLPGMGETTATKLLAEVAKAKQQPLHRLLTALGVRKTGRSLSRRISAHFGTMEALMASTANGLMAVEGIGEGRATIIRAELDDLAPMVAELVTQGWNNLDDNYSADGDTDDRPRPLDGMKVVVTGGVPGYNRTEVAELIERLGGKSSGSVSKTTDLLISDGPGSSKHTKAEALGVRIEGPEWLVAEAVKAGA